MRDCLIKSVKTCKEKEMAFRHNMIKYKKAYSCECYLEALWITYSMIEDRTSAFLYYCGFTYAKSKTRVTPSKGIKKSIRKILKMDAIKDKYHFDKLDYKLKAISKIINWNESDEPENDYESILKQRIQKIDCNKELLTEIGDWKDRRNELIHALFNKNVDDADEQTKKLVDDGYKYMRAIDNCVKSLKRGKNIRQRFHIQ